MPRPEDYAARAKLVRQRGMAAIADGVIGRWFTPAFPGRRPDLVAGIRSLLLATQPEGYAGACEAVASMDLYEDVARIGAPTLLIAGAEDPATPPELSREIDRRIKSATVVVIPGASHLATIEQPEAITGQILAQVTSSAGGG
jgi:3-oxoadipate enol-lactonase